MKELGTNGPDSNDAQAGDLRGFGEAPAYTRPAVLGAALLSIWGALAHGILGALDLGQRLWPGMLYLGTASFLLVYGITLMIRFVEARDAMHDPSPRLRLYDRHERGIYLTGLLAALACSMAGLLWLGLDWLDRVRWGPWHLLPVLLTLGVALLYRRLWRDKR